MNDARCTGEGCDLKDECKRFTSKAKQEFLPLEKGEECGYFWPILTTPIQVRVTDAAKNKKP